MGWFDQCWVDQIITYVKSHSSCVFYCLNYKMTTKQLKIKNRSYYFYNGLINVLNFEAGNLKLGKKIMERS